MGVRLFCQGPLTLPLLAVVQPALVQKAALVQQVQAVSSSSSSSFVEGFALDVSGSAVQPEHLERQVAEQLVSIQSLSGLEAAQQKWRPRNCRLQLLAVLAAMVVVPAAVPAHVPSQEGRLQAQAPLGERVRGEHRAGLRRAGRGIVGTLGCVKVVVVIAFVFGCCGGCGDGGCCCEGDSDGDDIVEVGDYAGRCVGGDNGG